MRLQSTDKTRSTEFKQILIKKFKKSKARLRLDCSDNRGFTVYKNTSYAAGGHFVSAGGSLRSPGVTLVNSSKFQKLINLVIFRAI